MGFIACFVQVSYSQSLFSEEEKTILKVAAGIPEVFREYNQYIWPGYDLSQAPFVLYVQDEWLLFLNSAKKPEDFEPYPADWPALGTSAFIHWGKYRNLEGQFKFDFSIDTISTFAMGLPKGVLSSLPKPTYTFLGTTIHEGFHQFQKDKFGEVPWAREELYPILDKENAAMASLEMNILKDALDALFLNERNRVIEKVKLFTAVRLNRWEKSDGFIKKYEQGQEIREGTARYVEMKAIQYFLSKKPKKNKLLLLRELNEDLNSLVFQELMTKDIESQLNKLAVLPEKMLRNRIYPIGASLGFLSDYLNIEWKDKFQMAGQNISFPDLFMKELDINQGDLFVYLSQAVNDYSYDAIKRESDSLINRYYANYESELEIFSNQNGLKIQVEIPGNNLQRFRATNGKKWVINEGKITFCAHYNLYSLNNETLKLEVRDQGVLEKTDREENRKYITFFGKDISKLVLDNKEILLANLSGQSFDSILLKGEKVGFETLSEGRLEYDSKNRILKIIII